MDEVRSKLVDLDFEKVAYSVTEVEASLPFLRQCVRENFRTTPVFTMPLPRRVMAPEGIIIAGEHIEQGVGDKEYLVTKYGPRLMYKPDFCCSVQPCIPPRPQSLGGRPRRV